MCSLHAALFWAAIACSNAAASPSMEESFASPPDAARPWVYLMIMDGNLTREGLTADFEAMQAAGIGGMIIMEVDVGIPRGPVAFMSDPWCGLLRHAVEEAERLGLAITLNAGPGWTGSGGPWVPPEQSMQHLVASETEVTGPVRFDAVLPRPDPRPPYFGMAGLPDEMLQSRLAFYADEAVLAVRRTDPTVRIEEVDQKALYVRDPYTSMPGVRPFIMPPSPGAVDPPEAVIPAQDVVILTDRLQSDGRVVWDVPPGSWTILRFGRRITGANTRPAPRPGLGWECDKFDTAALDAHFDAFVGRLLRTIGPRPLDRTVGWTMLHIDSWEMGSQNWSADFAVEFERRRGYSPIRYLPAMTGRIVESREVSERFLWDLRRTAQELVIERHAEHLRALGRRHGFGLSIEPYDMNPAGDMTLGGVADVPMGEFWSRGRGFESAFSCIEAASVAHTTGRPIVGAEAFTADASEAWQQFPAAMKDQGDWALCAGVNRLVFHRYAHQPWLDRRPGMTMGPYGVHWERTQTWWPLARAYHEYLARCQYLLRQGRPVADICYLVPEGAPHVFRAPPSALDGLLGDRRGYNFTACTPEVLLASATVEDGCVVFPGGLACRLLVLPGFDTMTPALLRRVVDLAAAGATVVGSPPERSPSLTDYPQCDQQVRAIVRRVWGETPRPDRLTQRQCGRGRVIFGGDLRSEPAAAPRVHPITRAQWIWFPEGNPAAGAPPGRCGFQRHFELDDATQIAAAELEMTADNGFQAWINGQLALQGDNFHVAYRADVSALLRAGRNTIRVDAVNGGAEDNPAGLIGALEIRGADNRLHEVVTDQSWWARRMPDGAEAAADAPGEAQWVAARELGAYDMAPWTLQPERGQVPELYPSYEAVAQQLAHGGVPPDFTADGSIRYAHRVLPDRDIYFVANRTSEHVATCCTFRVSGRIPELWDPLCGTRRPLPEYSQVDGCLQVPLEFEPYQSYFVLFRTPDGTATPSPAGARNFPSAETVGVVEGGWEVEFPASQGGPGRLQFARLEDWSQQAAEPVRHFSGIATYRRSFDLPAGARAAGTALRLDLGQVHNLARVRLNGRDLGVVWCAPWSVDITSAVRDRDNQLEIEVANLWPNRLIGDAALAPEARHTHTTWSPYRATDALLPSGLLGPVTLRRQREP